MTIQSIGALIFFTSRLPEMLLFYRTIGMPLELTDSGKGNSHYACDLGDFHFAIYESVDEKQTEVRRAGSAITGFAIDRIEEIHQKLLRLGTLIDQEPEEKPWGIRLIAVDPDGRLIELFEDRQMH